MRASARPSGLGRGRVRPTAEVARRSLPARAFAAPRHDRPHSAGANSGNGPAAEVDADRGTDALGDPKGIAAHGRHAKRFCRANSS